MTARLLCLLLGCLSLGVAWAQTKSRPAQAVAKEFLELESSGAFLTDAGWRAANRLIVKPTPPPEQIALSVRSGKVAVYVPDPFPTDKNRAQFETTYLALGQVDAMGRFFTKWRPLVMDPGTGKIVVDLADPKVESDNANGVKIKAIHEMMLTDTWWELDPESNTLRSVKGRQPEWRFYSLPFQSNVPIVTAIAYLTRLRATTKSAAIRANAGRSIASLHWLEDQMKKSGLSR